MSRTRIATGRPRASAALTGLVAAGLVLGTAACGTTASTTDAAGPPGRSTGPAAAPAAGPASPVVAADPDLPTLKLTASETGDMFTYAGPKEAGAGPLLVELTNEGKLDHQISVAKLKAGVTYDQVDQVLGGPNPTMAIAFVDLFGGPNAVAPGATGKAVVDLTEGDYYVLCFIPDTAGKPHVSHGMFQHLKIDPAGSATAAAEPQSSGTITLQDFSVVLPDDFTGKGWYKVVNEGKQPHEATAYQLAPGTTEKDFTTWQTAADAAAKGAGPAPTTPPPFTSAGGVSAAGPGVTQWIALDLDRSQHNLFVCFIPDVTKGFTPHWMEGMLTPWPSGS